MDTTKLKNLIEEYEELTYELNEMIDDWENGSPQAAALSDPSDQFMKETEIENKYEEIKKFLDEM